MILDKAALYRMVDEILESEVTEIENKAMGDPLLILDHTDNVLFILIGRLFHRVQRLENLKKIDDLEKQVEEEDDPITRANKAAGYRQPNWKPSE